METLLLLIQLAVSLGYSLTLTTGPIKEDNCYMWHDKAAIAVCETGNKTAKVYIIELKD